MRWFSGDGISGDWLPPAAERFVDRNASVTPPAYLVLGVDELADLLHHQIVEVRMVSVHGAVDAHSGVRALDLVENSRDCSGDEIRGSSRDALADQLHVLTVRLGCSHDVQLRQSLACFRILALRVRLDHRDERSVDHIAL